jgi:hypothetical protein
LDVEGRGGQLERRSPVRRISLFLFIVLSGLYLWFPRQLTSGAAPAHASGSGVGLPGKARDFNWHNVIGFWSMIPLFLGRHLGDGHLISLGEQSRLSCSG